MSHNYNSEIDRFFTIKLDGNGKRLSGKCQFCPNKVVIDQYTGNYWKHLEKMHPAMYRDYSSARDSNSNSNNHVSMECEEFSETEVKVAENEENEENHNKRPRIGGFKQETLQYPSTSRSKLSKFHQSTAETFAELGLPHSILENKRFRQLFVDFEMLKCSETLKFANKKQHKECILSSAAELFNDVIKTLQNNSNFITLAIDGGLDIDMALRILIL